MNKQETTYHEGTYNIKSTKDFYNGELIQYQIFDEDGRLMEELNNDGYIMKYHIDEYDNYAIYHRSGHKIGRSYNEHNDSWMEAFRKLQND